MPDGAAYCAASSGDGLCTGCVRRDAEAEVLRGVIAKRNADINSLLADLHAMRLRAEAAEAEIHARDFR